MTFLTDAGAAALHIFLESSLYVLAGFLAAGLVRAFLWPELIAARLGGGGFRSVLYASLLGVPIPLCSCGAVPAVAGLRGGGASRGACISFLISTPETGADSIALTYGLMGPVMAALRPLVALVSALVAGVAENLFGDGGESGVAVPTGSPAAPQRSTGYAARAWAGVWEGLRFAFGDLARDTAPWLVLGMSAAGLISALLPDSLLSGELGAGWRAHLGALIAGLPMYMCATLSTPIAAALIAKGLCPGAALILLMTGPATNIATMVMVGGLFGRRSLFIYLASIVGCALIAAIFADWLFDALGVTIGTTLAPLTAENGPRVAEWTGAILLSCLVLRGLWLRVFTSCGAETEEASCGRPGAQGSSCRGAGKHRESG